MTATAEETVSDKKGTGVGRIAGRECVVVCNDATMTWVDAPWRSAG